MREIIIDPGNPDPRLLAEAAEILKAGGLAVLPTDTVYGLAARLDSPDSIERVFAVKGRAVGKGLIAMIADERDLAGLAAEFSSAAGAMAAHFWPGPLTLVLPANENIPTKALVRGKIGVRLPDHNMLRELIRAVGGPLATTSANLSGRPSPVDAESCREELGGRVDLIVDAGPCSLGVESTVVDIKIDALPEIVREGAISVDSIMEVWRRNEDR
jgi:L-threonylcarbamoyladenylate synthase